jgi:hypothetical protein
VLSAAASVPGPFAVVNADDFYGAAAYQTLAAHQRSVRADSADYAVVGFPLSETLTESGGVNRALLRTGDDGLLEHVEEVIGIEAVGGGRASGRGVDGSSRALSTDALVSMNMWGLTPAIFSQLDSRFRRFLAAHGTDEKAEFLLPTEIQVLVHGGEARVRVLRGEGPWCGVTYPDDREHVQRTLAELVARGEYSR